MQRSTYGLCTQTRCSRFLTLHFPPPPAQVREGAAWVLSLLAVPTTGKTLCVEEKIVGDLIPMLEDPELSLRAAAAGALMSVTIDIYAKAQFQEEGGAGPILQLLEVNDVKLQVKPRDLAQSIP